MWTCAVIAGSGDVTIGSSGDIANWIVQGAVQRPELASRMAWRSEPLPLSLELVTTSVEAPVTVTVSGSLLFALFGSDSASDTVAVLTCVPPVVAVATMVIVTCAPEAIAPMLHETLVPVVQVPCVELAVVAVCPGGSGSFMTTALAGDGPKLLTVTV